MPDTLAGTTGTSAPLSRRRNCTTGRLLAELLVVRRAPAAYKQCLAECVRRGAFMEKYAASAAKLAEGMGRFREKVGGCVVGK